MLATRRLRQLMGIPCFLLNMPSVSNFLQIRNLMIAIHDAVPDPKVAGLLGLNFLSNFRLDIDTQKGFLHLEKK